MVMSLGVSYSRSWIAAAMLSWLAWRRRPIAVLRRVARTRGREPALYPGGVLAVGDVAGVAQGVG
jgi:hypothetical protein